MKKTDLQPHIRCGAGESARYAILPGDPKRVDRIAEYLTDVEPLAYNREYKSIRGKYKGVPVMAVSTGIGGASMGIAVEELRRIGVEAMIRIGSCGALQPDIRLGDLILLSGTVRDEGTSKTYIDPIYPAIPDTELLLHTINAAREKGFQYHVGCGRSHDGFYTDQEEEIDRFWAGKRVLGADMETAALFVIGGLRGIRTASILNTVVEYDGTLEDGVNSYVDGDNPTRHGEENEILTALEVFYKVEKEGYSL